MSLATGENGLQKVVLQAGDGASAEVYLHGAHVTSWRPSPGRSERLFLSAASRFGGGSAIRGGIPVIFPQFAAEGPLPRHGFARTMPWALVEQSVVDGRASATLALESNARTQAIWPADFSATLTVDVGGPSLVVTLAVENRGASAFTFTAALHTYLRVDDVEDVSVSGLHGVRYRESANPSLLVVDDAASLRIEGEVDRVYVGAPPRIVLHESTRELVIESTGMPDAVVWNPGAGRAAALDDMEPGGERRMLCVEAAVVQLPITLDAGGRWSGSQALTA